MLELEFQALSGARIVGNHKNLLPPVYVIVTLRWYYMVEDGEAASLGSSDSSEMAVGLDTALIGLYNGSSEVSSLQVVLGVHRQLVE